MQLKIKQYLADPAGHPRPQIDEDPQFAYLISYFGDLFIQGYRIIEKYPQMILLSSFHFQTPHDDPTAQSRHSKFNHQPHFRIVYWQLTSKQLFDSGKYRKEIYTQMLEVGALMEDVEYHMIYLRECRYSILENTDLERNNLPSCKYYFSKIKWIEEKNGPKPIMEKEQGIQLHRLVETFIKGGGQARNRSTIRKIQGQNKFIYDLFKVINTVCYIVGKEVFENDYQAMSVEKWMRKVTIKEFKRYDLLLRNQQKCCIVDWKFTRLHASDKIKGAGVQRKNKLYYQLAKKDFKTDIELKFYCFHQRITNKSYHYFTVADFKNQISTVDVEQIQKKVEPKQKEKQYVRKGSKNKGKKQFDFKGKDIVIDDEDVELLEDDGEEIKVISKEKQVTKQNSVIAIDDSQQQQNLDLRNNEIPIEQNYQKQIGANFHEEVPQAEQQKQQCNPVRELITAVVIQDDPLALKEPELSVQFQNYFKKKKQEIKQQKFVQKFGPIVYQIESD